MAMKYLIVYLLIRKIKWNENIEEMILGDYLIVKPK